MPDCTFQCCTGRIVPAAWDSSGKDSLEEAEGAGIEVQGGHVRLGENQPGPGLGVKGYCKGLPAGRQADDLKPGLLQLRR